jgi:cell division protein FtsB
MSLVAEPRPASRPDARRPGAEPLRRKPQGRRPVTGAVSPVRRRTIHLLLVFVTVVLVVDALVGDKGLMQTIRARRQHRELAASLDDLRRRNGGLREDIRQLREDPAAIEALARKELGLLRPGEVLFIVKDAERRTGQIP